MKNSTKALLLSWLRAYIGIGAGLFGTGTRGWELVINTALYSVIPPAIRFIDKNDPAFGRYVAKAVAVAAEEIAKPKPKPAPKAKKTK